MIILVKGNFIVPNTEAADNWNTVRKNIIFEKCTPFIDCVYEINNMETVNAKDTDVVMSRYNLLEYSDNCSKTSGSL